MNFFQGLFARPSSSQTQNAVPAYPGTSAPKASATGYPRAVAGEASEENWSVDVEGKPSSLGATARHKAGATTATDVKKLDASQRARDLEVSREAALAESRRQQEEQARRCQEALRQQREEERKREEELKKQDEAEAFLRVDVAMYDLSNGLARFVPAALLSGYKFEGIWHTGCRVFGKEIWFGGGIVESEFDESPFGLPVKTVRLGKTTRSYQELIEFIRDDLCHVYNTRNYHFLSRNCNHFSNEVVKFLLNGKQLPEEVLLQPQCFQNGALAQLMIPAMNTWLGGFGNEGSAVAGAPQITHMTRAEKDLENKRLAAQWAEWAQERQRQRQVELEERRKDDEADAFQNWMLEQHQRMEDEEKLAQVRAEQEEERRREQAIRDEALRLEREQEERQKARERKAAEEQRLKEEREAEERRRWEQANPGLAERRREAEQTLRDIVNAGRGAETAVIEWALSEAREAGVNETAPFLIRDAEYALRERKYNNRP